jgi:hypothetical protein
MQRTSELKRIRPLQPRGRGVTERFRLLGGKVRVRLPSAPLGQSNLTFVAARSAVRAGLL